jgi:hypothetical protein
MESFIAICTQFWVDLTTALSYFEVVVFLLWVGWHERMNLANITNSDKTVDAEVRQQQRRWVLSSRRVGIAASTEPSFFWR